MTDHEIHAIFLAVCLAAILFAIVATAAIYLICEWAESRQRNRRYRARRARRYRRA